MEETPIFKSMLRTLPPQNYVRQKYGLGYREALVQEGVLTGVIVNRPTPALMPRRRNLQVRPTLEQLRRLQAVQEYDR